MDGEIEERAGACHICASVGKLQCKAPLHLRRWPVKPWERLYIYFFKKDKLNFLIVIDAYSKWLEVIPMSSTTTVKTIEALRTLFSCYSIPKEVVSDSGL